MVTPAVIELSSTISMVYKYIGVTMFCLVLKRANVVWYRVMIETKTPLMYLKFLIL